MRRSFKMCHNLLATVRNNAWQLKRSIATECWNCSKSLEGRGSMMCTQCGHLQDVDTKINYFDLLNFPIGFAVESRELSQRFRQLQSLVHPDKFSNKSEREQSNSAEWSALINRAYKTLATPIERGRYLLKVHGRQMPQNNSALNPAFLMQMMEANEQVDETNDLNELQVLRDKTAQELQQETVALNQQFEAKAFEQAIEILVKMKYLQSMLENIKNKIDAINYKND